MSPMWRGRDFRRSTCAKGLEPYITLEELRDYWRPISPIPYIGKLHKLGRRPMRFIAARYDLTFPLDLTHDVIAEVRAT